ncbi:transcriptional regulator family: Fungal Specific TF [Penicillium chermesinum]|uniref:Transcriptional regulator family: Fungal Specific TF n=1 Tax=Penicillium chermesinum TaxID=63820 RepID=A0A9W9NE43_9EURO|nr:transcriptional regulator family: Fungal Specific TF [Penicillium chermesinum]KAJ5217239.1 transcriptional regulator family: Fungal Specific TF [Penicillium chermesinum]KAJ6171145.1 transcriptional regulator family: Fungal Specific TF [Penicillium chermesinum]
MHNLFGYDSSFELTGYWQNLCHYDSESKWCQSARSHSGESRPSEASSGSSGRPLLESVERHQEWSGDIHERIRDFGYSSHGVNHSMSLLRTAELYIHQPPTSSGSRTAAQPSQSDVNRKYKELVRQLPSQACIDNLAQTFFAEINWQYAIIDEGSFRDSLAAWKEISYSDLQEGFGRLALETLVFPALLFQILSQALLFHPPDETTDNLITMPNMTYQDLGCEYSERGADLLALLGKKDMTISIVQAGLLRASFLKSSGRVVEAWHVLGATIRDAQELGLHTGKIVPGQSPVTLKRGEHAASLVGHRLWVVLHIWDIHMAVVLGRPIATNLQIDRFAMTAEDEKGREMFLHWQTETDPPRPFDVILAGYNVAYRYFQDIHLIDSNGASPQDYPIVERIHEEIKGNLGLLPSWCRLERPDTRFDQLDECQWLPAARDGLSSLIHLVILTLHRPFIFSVASSRTEALKAGISILRAQERMFENSEPRQRKVFNPVYASFDAIVLIAALCLVFPNENQERQAECLDVVAKGIQRLGIIGQSNDMATVAHGVVCSLYHRVRHRLGMSDTVENNGAYLANPYSTPLHRDPDLSRRAPSEFPFETVLPPRPTHDLFFEQISVPQMPFTDATNDLPSHAFICPTDRWNLEGDFADASFWSLLNELNN